MSYTYDIIVITKKILWLIKKSLNSKVFQQYTIMHKKADVFCLEEIFGK